VWVGSLTIGKPAIETGKSALSAVLYPSECRERGITYRAKMQAKICWRVNEGPVQSDTRSLGSLPILVRVIPLI
jgi:DNA-directed RNA polymerase I subunit RPA2